MTRFHLTITIFNPFFEEKIKCSLKKLIVFGFMIVLYFFDKVLQGMSYSDINKFKLNLFELV